MEFALVFPLLLFMVLVLAQVTFLMTGNLFVHYAAYAATRSAIVQVPQPQEDDGPNHYTHSRGNTKCDRIHEAAAIALMPVGGRQTSTNSSVNANAFVGGLGQYYTGHNEPNWVANLAADRLRYALDNTSVAMMRPVIIDERTVEFREIGRGETHYFEARDPITTVVTHRLNLGIPYANRIFAQGENPHGPGRHVVVTAGYTLTNEGVRDELPPMPTIPRETPN
jgi:hypothetical protein